MKFKVKYYDEVEEKWNVWSHAFGFLISLFVFPFLVAKAVATKDINTIVSFVIYGVSMSLLYAASTLYHSAKNRRTRYYLNFLDHSAIYVLIAGSYAPISLVVLGGTLGWCVFTLSWLVAVLGILYKVYFLGKYKAISVFSYLIMGWLIIFFLKPLVQNLSLLGQRWLLLGGVFYSIGACFFVANKIKYNHAIFHGFVLLGSVCHFVLIYYYVL